MAQLQGKISVRRGGQSQLDVIAPNLVFRADVVSQKLSRGKSGRHREGQWEGVELLKDLHTRTGFLRTLPPS